MSRLRIRVAVTSVLGVLGLLASGCSGSSSTSAAPDPSSIGSQSSSPATPTSSTPQPPAAPEIGQCRDLKYPAISLYSNPAKATPCARPHTAYTFAVEELPNDIAFDGVEIQNDAVQKAAADLCQTSFVDFIGGDTATRALSRLTVTYFLPEQKGFGLGAHWVRCDVVALKSANSLATLPTDVKGFLDTANPLTDYGVCASAEPGAVGTKLVICSENHAYRAMEALRLGTTKAPYPGQDTTLAAGKQRCQNLISKKLGVSSGFTYGWTYPSPADWTAGQRFGYCWNKTAK